jgi:hypothetical protein
MLTKHENIEYNQVNMSQIVNAENPNQEQKSQVHDHDISTWRDVGCEWLNKLLHSVLVNSLLACRATG